MKPGGAKHRKKQRRISRQTRSTTSQQKKIANLPQNRGVRIQVAGKRLYNDFTRKGQPIPPSKIEAFARAYDVDPERLIEHLLKVRGATIKSKKK